MPDKPPIASAGNNLTVTKNTNFFLDGSASYNPDGNIMSYSWTQIAGTPAVTLSNSSAPNPSFVVPVVPKDTTFTFHLTVKDNANLTSSSIVNIKDVGAAPTIHAADKPPIASAGNNLTVTKNTNFFLDGSASYNPDGNIMSYSWTQIAGTPAVTLSNSSAPNPSFVVPVVPKDTTFTFHLTVKDNANLTSSSIVNIKDVGAPIVTSPTKPITPPPPTKPITPPPPTKPITPPPPTKPITPPPPTKPITPPPPTKPITPPPPTKPITPPVVVWSGPPSKTFDDKGLGGKTSGTISDFGNQKLIIQEAPGRTGVNITAEPGGGPKSAIISACNNAPQYRLAANDQIIITCGSASTVVINGSPQVAFTANDGTKASATIPKGDILKFDPVQKTFLASKGNKAPITVLVQGKNGNSSLEVSPGATVSEPKVVSTGGGGAGTTTGGAGGPKGGPPGGGPPKPPVTPPKPPVTPPKPPVTPPKPPVTPPKPPVTPPKPPVTPPKPPVTPPKPPVTPPKPPVTPPKPPVTPPKPPIVKTNPDQVVNASSIVILDGSASSNPNGSKLTYLWKQISGVPLVALKNSSSAITTFTAPKSVPPTGSVLTFTLTVANAKGLKASKDVKITVKGSNKLPIANAGADQTVKENSIVTLDGSTSKAPLPGDNLTYSWKQTAGLPHITISAPNKVKATFKAPALPVVTGANVIGKPNNITLTFGLTVADKEGLKGNATSHIHVVRAFPIVPKPPIAMAGAAQTVKPGSIVTLDGSRSTDPNGGKLDLLVDTNCRDAQGYSR